jgi:hypothetical protein
MSNDAQKTFVDVFDLAISLRPVMTFSNNRTTPSHEEWELTILGLDQGMAFLLGPSSRGGAETGFVGDVGDQLGCDAAAPGQNPRS